MVSHLGVNHLWGDMAHYLEQRRGIYYFRQVTIVEGKQKARRISLKTKDLKIAKILSIQLLANIYQMTRKFEVKYREDGTIESLDIKDDADKARFIEIEELRQKHLAFKHKQELEALQFKERLRKEEEQRQAQEWHNSDKASLYERLQEKLNKKPLKTLKTYLSEYLDSLDVKNQQTHDKYRRVTTQFIEYCDSNNATYTQDINREFVWNYIKYLKEQEKSDKTIQNLFYTLSSFYNHLIRIGATSEQNPFAGHKFKVEKTKRIPFTVEELDKIFSCEKIINHKSLYFVCLMLLTSGARPSEICQLHHDDINKVNDIYEIKIKADEEKGQTVKTLQSQRTIYLHQLLIDRGFLTYLETRKNKSVFDIPKATGKNISKLISEDFSEILRKTLNIEVKTMYYFRHTAINRLKLKGSHIPNIRTISKDLIGHDDDEKTDTLNHHYEQAYTIDIIKAATEELLYYREVKALH